MNLKDRVFQFLGADIKENPINNKNVGLVEDGLKDVDTKNPEPLSNFVGIIPGEDVKFKGMKARTLATISGWYNALKQTEMTGIRWYLTTKIYREIALDPTVKATLEYRDKQLLSIPWRIETDGKIDEEMTNLFNSECFYKLFSLMIQSKYWGPKAVQIDELYSDGTFKFSEIPSFCYEPVQGVVSFFSGTGGQPAEDDERVYIRTTDPYYLWTLEYPTLKGFENLGLLNELAPYALWKKLAIMSQAEFCEAFGQPFVTIKTDKQDPNERMKMLNMLKDSGKSPKMILDLMDELTMTSPGNSTTTVFNDLINTCNSEIEKLILSSNVLMGNSNSTGSYNQAQNSSEEFHKMLLSDIRELEYWVNGYLIPRLQVLGVCKEGIKFRFDAQDNISPAIYGSVLQSILPFYVVDEKSIEKIYGINIIGQRTSVVSSAPNEENTTPKPDVKTE